MDTATEFRTAADDLDQAADLIDRVGWWDGKVGGAPNHCAVTSLGEVSGLGWRGYKSLGEFLGIPGATSQDVFDWNDAQPNGETVTAAMRQCAEKWRIHAAELVE